MNLRIHDTTHDIDWDLLVDILQKAGMAYYSSEIHKRAFEKSYTVAFVFDGDALVGFGRAISDGEYQAAIYDVAVLPDYQGKGIGRMLLRAIV